MSEPRRSGLRSIVAGIALVLLTALAVAVIKGTEPEPEREAAVKRTPMLVEIVTAEAGDYTPRIPATGVVRAAEDVTLRARVPGQVLRLSSDFEPGRVVQQGEILVELDRVDAANAVSLARSALELAQADLELEQGRQAVARIERDHISQEISPEQERLVLREPQLRAAQASVDAAKARLRQAETELSRARVRAPTRSLVLSRTVGVGSQVGADTPLGRLVAVDRFFVELNLRPRLLEHLPENSQVHIRDAGAWPADASRVGTLSGVVRELDERTRLARLLITVADPLGLNGDEPALSVGAFVDAELEATPLQSVVRLPRGVVRRGDVVWVMEEDTLRLVPVDVLLEDADYAYLKGLQPGAQVVVTDLATVKEGAPLRLAEGQP